MTPSTQADRWKLIQDIFEAALEVPLSVRAEYVARACGDDEDLRAEVSSLLANDRNETQTLHSIVATDLKRLADAAPEIGQRVGSYRLIRELDGGGMGIVYLAVRSDDQYFQIVAIKMVRKGMESPQLLQRFRTERQILATLTHPNIGAILDGGETEDGRPYIVMEYVEGQPITLACETRSLSIRQRIELFRSVCSAVQYAHQQLVIHRDIKPSNVLVTSEDIVKLIDFGISKPLAPELIPGELAPTEHGQRLLTPDYASPEQILGHSLTTSTDIYSLGVLLFELLTGERPYTILDLAPGAAARIVCEQESRKPSSVQGLSKRTRQLLAGDLDTIVLKAMEKDPAQRYGSADDLDQDLLRFLQGKPILARRASAIYRFRKFAARHKAASIMTCAACAVLTGSIIFESWQSRLADARAKQFQAFADSTISDLTQELQQSPKSVEVQASLFHRSLKYLDELRQSSANDPILLLKLSKAYERVADLEGAPLVAMLGKSGTALTSREKALQTAMEAHARLPGEESTRAVAEAYQGLGVTEHFLGAVSKADDNYEHSIFYARNLWQQKPQDPERKRLLAMSYARLGDLQLDNLEASEALKSYRAAFRTFGSQQTGKEDHDGILSRLYGRMAGAQGELGLQLEALANYRRAIDICETLAQSSSSSKLTKKRLLAAYNFIGGTLIGIETLNVGDSKQAEYYARKVLAVANELAGSDPKNPEARYYLSFAYEDMGASLRLTDPDSASAWYRKSILVTKEMAPDYPAGSQIYEMLAGRREELAAVLASRPDALERLHLLQQANGTWNELARANPGKPSNRLSLMRSYCNLSEAELALNDLAKARLYADLSLPLLDQFTSHSESLFVLRDLAFCYESRGNLQRRIAHDRSIALAERRAAAAASRSWYTKSAEVWSEWNRRGAATPESEIERHKVNHALQTTD